MKDGSSTWVSSHGGHLGSEPDDGRSLFLSLNIGFQVNQSFPKSNSAKNILRSFLGKSDVYRKYNSDYQELEREAWESGHKCLNWERLKKFWGWIVVGVSLGI